MGVIRQPADVSAMLPVAAKQDVSYEGQQNLFTSPAFLPLYAAGLGIPVNQIPDINLVSLRLHHGLDDWAAFASAANGIAHGSVDPTPGGDVYSARSAIASAQRGVHVDVVVLLLFASLLADHFRTGRTRSRGRYRRLGTTTPRFAILGRLDGNWFLL